MLDFMHMNRLSNIGEPPENLRVSKTTQRGSVTVILYCGWEGRLKFNDPAVVFIPCLFFLEHLIYSLQCIVILL